MLLVFADAQTSKLIIIYPMEAIEASAALSSRHE